MAITGLHLLLTYQCPFECDHCFVWGSPEAQGTMRLSDIRQILDEAVKLGHIEWIFFEGGEAFLYYPVLLRGLREANEMGFKTGIVTNAYWATSVEDAREWLDPISEIGVKDLSVSNDAFHYGEQDENLAKHAMKAAREAGLPVGAITIEDPQECIQQISWKGEPATGGAVMFKGRATEKLVEDMPRRPWTEFDECVDEDFANQGRVHLDSYGHVHVCQGISIGNFKETALAEIIEAFDPHTHPICAPILEGGPAELVRRYEVPHEDGYVDECHLCYAARQALRLKFPGYLAPGQMYGQYSDA